MHRTFIFSICKYNSAMGIITSYYLKSGEVKFDKIKSYFCTFKSKNKYKTNNQNHKLMLLYNGKIPKCFCTVVQWNKKK